MLISLKTRLRGACVIVGTFVAFSLAVFLAQALREFERNTQLAREELRLDEVDQLEKRSREVHDREKIRREDEARREASRREDERRREELAAQRFREKYATGSLRNAGDDVVVVAVKGEGTNPQSDIVRGRLTEMVAKADKKPFATVFKPAFYSEGRFDELWGGDSSLIPKLGVHDNDSAIFLLAKVTLSEATRTSFGDFVAVQGTLSICTLHNGVTNGPWVYNAEGAGSDPRRAAAACAERLVTALERDKIFAVAD
jgi:hypothetical protein